MHITHSGIKQQFDIEPYHIYSTKINYDVTLKLFVNVTQTVKMLLNSFWYSHGD